MTKAAIERLSGRGLLPGLLLFALVLMFGLQLAAGVELQSVKLTINLPLANDWDMFAAVEKGFFAKEGLAPETIYLTMPPDVVRFVVAGSAPLGTGGVHFSTTAQERGGKIRVVAGRVYSLLTDIVVRPEIKSLKDLRGKKITTAGLTSIFTHLFVEIMERSGVKKDEYQLLVVGTSHERFAAVKAGGAAATMLTPPVNFMANDEGYPTLAQYSDVIKALQFIGVFANTDFAKKSPDVVTRFVKALIQSQRWINNPANKEEAVRILMKHVARTPEPIARRTYDYLVVRNRAFGGEGAIDPEGMKASIDILTKYGQLKDPKPWQEYVDLTFYEKARKELGL